MLRRAVTVPTVNQPEANAASWTDRTVNPERWTAIEQHLGASLLDVGCGNGAYVLRLAPRVEAVGVDVAPYRSWSTAPNTFQVAQATALPFRDDAFDTVTCFEVLEHVPDPAQVLRELARVSRRHVIVSVPNCAVPDSLLRSRLTYFHYTDRTHVHFFTAATLTEALETAGIAVKTCDLINPCDLAPAVSELLHCSERVARLLVRVFTRTTFHMTCLAVGEVR